jgi:hypothetical protein
MATQYVIDWSDSGDKPSFIVGPGETNTQTSLNIYGQGAIAYGEGVFENLIKMLEHFSSDTAPRFPTKGQLWYKSDTGSMLVQNGIAARDAAAIKAGEDAVPQLSVAAVIANLQGAAFYNGPSPYDANTTYAQLYATAQAQGWVTVGGSIASPTQPTDTGLLWFDTSVNELKYWNGTAYVSTMTEFLRGDGTGASITDNITTSVDKGFVSSNNYVIPRDVTSFGSAPGTYISSEQNVAVVIDNQDSGTDYGFVVAHNKAPGQPTNSGDFLLNVRDVAGIDAYRDLNMNGNDILNIGTFNATSSSFTSATITGLTVTNNVTAGTGTFTSAQAGPLGSNSSAPAEGNFSVIINNTPHGDSGGLLVYTNDNGDEKAFEVVNTANIISPVFRIWNNPQATTLQTVYSNGTMFSDVDVSTFTPASMTKALVTKEFMEQSIAAGTTGATTGLAKVHVQSAQPSSPNAGDIWIADTGSIASPNVQIYIYSNGTSGSRWNKIFPAQYAD